MRYRLRIIFFSYAYGCQVFLPTLFDKNVNFFCIELLLQLRQKSYLYGSLSVCFLCVFTFTFLYLCLPASNISSVSFSFPLHNLTLLTIYLFAILFLRKKIGEYHFLESTQFWRQWEQECLLGDWMSFSLVSVLVWQWVLPLTFLMMMPRQNSQGFSSKKSLEITASEWTSI